MTYHTRIFNKCLPAFILLLLLLPSTNSIAQYAIGDTVTDFTLTRLTGEQLSLSDFAGQVILLNFFTTW